MLRSIGTTELLIVAFIVILLFGGKKIPEFFKGMGDSIREFKNASRDDNNEKETK